MPVMNASKGSGPLQRYEAYIEHLRWLTSGPATPCSDKVSAALDGEAGRELRSRVPVTIRRQIGAFFTGSALSKKLLDIAAFRPNRNYHDPACGMGDLLLAAARRLPVRASLKSTIRFWGEILSGSDIHETFVVGTKIRLVLLARQRHGDWVTPFDHHLAFPKIVRGDGLQEFGGLKPNTTVLLNPPFGFVRSTSYSWGKGKVSRAAVFVSEYLARLPAGGELAAILPDVLRSGSFSQGWRSLVAEIGRVLKVEAHGIFDTQADVDVFLLRVLNKKRPFAQAVLWVQPLSFPESVLGDLFEVRVGRVVPYRDPQKGSTVAYIHPRGVPPWEEMRRFSEYRRHAGAPFEPPFVVIRRTSRPGDRYRATASVISGSQPVAVENHFIVCSPLDRRIETCRDLIQQLKQPGVNEFLDSRIRCRHLTVKAVSEIPLLGFAK
jgi:hypothetical protein